MKFLIKLLFLFVPIWPAGYLLASDLRNVDQDLFVAIKKKSSVEEIKTLLQKGADVNARDRIGMTPLMKAALDPNLITIATALLKARAQIDVKDYIGRNALQFAINSDNDKLVQELIKHGVAITSTFVTTMLEEITTKDSSLSRSKIGSLLINALFKKLFDTKRSYKEVNELYKAVSLFIERNKNFLSPQEITNLSYQLSKLSNKYSFTSPLLPQFKKYSLNDLLQIFEVSVVEDKVLDNPTDALPTITPGTVGLTQTESYLSIPTLRQSVIEGYGNELIKYPKLVQRIIAQEKKFKDYDVFYHGQKRDFILFYDVIKEIQNWFDKTAHKAEFQYVRLPEEQNKKLSEYTRLGELIDDHEPEINQTLLPVNLSLFGNTSKYGEATFQYFLASKNINPPENLLRELFDKLELSTDFIPKILDLLTYLESPTGNLLQIFIPRNKVNQYVYPSVAYAKPLSTSFAQELTPLKLVKITNPTASWYNLFGKYTGHDLKTIDMKTYLNLYRNHPEAIDPQDLDAIQGRINITRDFLLEPKSGVKIFRYNTVDSYRLLEYQQKLRQLITEVMQDWMKRNTTPATAQQVIAKEFTALADAAKIRA